MALSKTLWAAMDGPEYGLKAAWFMARATYDYTRSHDGDVIDDAGNTISFGRWYSFCAAVSIGWEYLWPPES